MKLRPVLTASALGGILAAANALPAYAEEIEVDTTVVDADISEVVGAEGDLAAADEASPTEEPNATETAPAASVESSTESPPLEVPAEPEALPEAVEAEPSAQVPEAPAESTEPVPPVPVDPPAGASQDPEQSTVGSEDSDAGVADEPTASEEQSAQPVTTEQDEAATVSNEAVTSSPGNSTTATTQDVTASDAQQVTVADAQALAEALVGENIEILNVTYTGHEQAAGFFSGFEDAIGLDSGIILSTGYADHQYAADGTIIYRAVLYGPNDDDATSGYMNTPGDDDLDALVDDSTRDAAVLEIEFIPTHDTIAFNYVFGSEEYLEWVDSSYNDVFAFFVNGVNYATLEDGTVVSVNSINHLVNEDYFRNNPQDEQPFNTGLDGMTVVLSFEAPVNPGVVNILKLAIADVSDDALDSAVMIQAGSFTSPVPNTPPVADDILVEMESMEPVVIVLTGSDADGDDLTYHIVSTDQLAGTLTIDGANVVFTPQTGFVGFTTFGYLVNDGTVDSEVAYVLIFVPGEDGETPDPTDPPDSGETPEPTDPGGEQPAPGEEQPAEPDIQPVEEMTEATPTDWVAKTAEEPRALYVHEAADEVTVTTLAAGQSGDSNYVTETGLAETGATAPLLALGGVLLIVAGAGLTVWRRRAN